MDPIPIKYNRGDIPFLIRESPIGYTLLDFWSWAFSDVITNTIRGMVAEFIVALALEIDIRIPRDAWSKFDLSYRDHGIEVKSSSYYQRWYQKSISKISFNIPKRQGWEAKPTNLTLSRRDMEIFMS
jgi:hypothetical protein